MPGRLWLRNIVERQSPVKISSRRRREIVKALEQERVGWDLIERTPGDHVRITLSNGRKVFTGTTPGDNRALKKMMNDVRKEAHAK